METTSTYKTQFTVDGSQHNVSACAAVVSQKVQYQVRVHPGDLRLSFSLDTDGTFEPYPSEILSAELERNISEWIEQEYERDLKEFALGRLAE